MAAKFRNPNDYEDDDSTLDLEITVGNVLPRLESKVLEILIPLIQSTNENQSIQNAVKEINELYPIEMKEFPEANEVDDFFWIFYPLLFIIAERIPYNHPKQERLIKFLITLRKTANGSLTMGEVCVSYFFPSHKIIPTHYILVVDGEAN
jgi:hypothetical protein